MENINGRTKVNQWEKASVQNKVLLDQNQSKNHVYIV